MTAPASPYDVINQLVEKNAVNRDSSNPALSVYADELRDARTYLEAAAACIARLPAGWEDARPSLLAGEVAGELATALDALARLDAAIALVLEVPF